MAAKRKAAARREPKLYLVFGGRVRDTEGEDFAEPARIDTIGYFRSYAAALRAWQGASQRHVDDAFVKYVIVELW
jgi:hypothetical protein